jgi:hypothetical protein
MNEFLEADKAVRSALEGAAMKPLTQSVSSLPLPMSATRNDWTPELFEEITDLMAEALFQDFQAHRRATVQSPQGIDREIIDSSNKMLLR